MNTVLSHSNDTVAAHEAAEYMQKSGKAQRHKTRVMNVLYFMEGITVPEIGFYSGLGHTEAQRRVSDLKNEGRIKYGDKAWRSIKKKMISSVWVVK